MTARNIRHAFYLLIGLAGLFTTWPFAFDWMAEGNSILDFVKFFADALASGGTAAFLTIDMAVAWTVFMVWAVSDSMRIGLGLKVGIGFVLLSYIGVCLAFPTYLIVRERYLDQQNVTG